MRERGRERKRKERERERERERESKGAGDPLSYTQRGKYCITFLLWSKRELVKSA